MLRPGHTRPVDCHTHVVYKDPMAHATPHQEMTMARWMAGVPLNRCRYVVPLEVLNDDGVTTRRELDCYDDAEEAREAARGYWWPRDFIRVIGAIRRVTP